MEDKEVKGNDSSKQISVPISLSCKLKKNKTPALITGTDFRDDYC